MSFSTKFVALMPSTVTVSTLVSLSTDGRGIATYSTGTDYRARIVRKQELVRTFEGTEEVANTLVYIASTSTFSPALSLITFTGSTDLNLLALSAFPDQDGIHHLKAAYG